MSCLSGLCTVCPVCMVWGLYVLFVWSVYLCVMFVWSGGYMSCLSGLCTVCHVCLVWGLCLVCLVCVLCVLFVWSGGYVLFVWLPSYFLHSQCAMHMYSIYMTLIIHEILRKKGNATQHNRKTKQHNTTRPRQLFFKDSKNLHVYSLFIW